MARLPIPGSDEGVWGEVLNNYLSIEHNSDGTQKTLPISRGGTGATSIADAQKALGVGSSIPLYVQNSNPGSTTPHLWIQTGLGANGTDMTFWVEDGR